MIKPNPALAGYVKYFWYLENKSGDYTEMLYPTGEMQMLFHFGTPFINVTNENEHQSQKQHVLAGQNFTPSRVKSLINSDMIGVVFYPYSASAFFNIPLNEITGTEIEVTDAIDEWKLLKENFLNTENFNNRFNLVENFLIKRLNVKKPEKYYMAKHLVTEIINKKGMGSISDLFKENNLSEKKAERLFKNYVGLSPKKYFDIARLHNAISLMYKNTSLTYVSYNSGYFDQSHFTRKFKEFTGITPSEFLKICPTAEHF